MSDITAAFLDLDFCFPWTFLVSRKLRIIHRGGNKSRTHAILVRKRVVTTLFDEGESESDLKHGIHVVSPEIYIPPTCLQDRKEKAR